MNGSKGRTAWVESDEDGLIVRVGGDPEALWGTVPRVGARLADEFPTVEGLGPEGIHLPTMSMVPDVTFDMVCSATRSGHFLVAVERTDEAKLTRRLQQSRLELELELGTLRRELDVALVDADLAVFRESASVGGFVWLGPDRPWVRERFGPELRVGDAVDLLGQSDFLDSLWTEMELRPELEAFDTIPFHEAEGPMLQARVIRRGLKSRLVVLARHHEGEAPGLRWLQTGREVQLDRQCILRLLEERDVLVQCVVHDLAGPLQAVSSALALLQDGAEDGRENAEYLQLALQETDRQSRMIREIEQIFAAGTPGESLEEVDVAQAAAAIIPVLQLSWPSIQFVVQGSAPPRVRAELDRMLRVLQNLLDNAARHSPHGGVVQVRLTSASASSLRVSVHDSGSGVSSDLDVFERGSKGRRGGRWGLGLFFCKITVERWSGRIGHGPSDLGGEEFWFELNASVTDPKDSEG